MSNLTESQRQQLAQLRDAVIGDKRDQCQAHVIGKVALITGRDWRAAMNGVEIMRTEGMLPDGAFRGDTDGMLPELTMRNPSVAELLDRMSLIPVKIAFCAWCRPPIVSPDALRKKFIW